uniref:Serine hydroxymethyltransferase n=1 Tax=Alexandrium monilatum TaxID=311494 RepID=A0A7S4SUN9_9DINO
MQCLRAGVSRAAAAAVLRPARATAARALGRAISTEAMQLNVPLKDTDPEISTIIENEKDRQRRCVNLIASENFAPLAVLEAVGSVMVNKYSEGYPGARYYGGNEFIDQAESLCQQRALQACRLDPKEWGVNVQSLSGSPANFQVFTALCNVHDRIMGLDLPHGGHLSHGYQTDTKKISMVSKYFESIPYRLNEETGLIDYDECEKFAMRIRPKILIAGTSAYSRLIDYGRMRQIADRCGAYLLADMAHISGLVVGGTIPSPFEFADVVTTTTHKSLRGPRGAMIFFRRGQRSVDKKGNPIMYDLEEKINAAVFPGLQGGPHNQSITALAVALKMAQAPEFRTYQEQVMKNAKALGESLQGRSFDLVSGGTDNHLLLIDLRSKGVNGSKAEAVCEQASIVLNKNTIPGDKSAMNPNGLRVGTPAMTSRGLMEEDFVRIGEFIGEAVDVAAEVQKQSGPKLVEFKKVLKESPPGRLLELKTDVENFAGRFATVGF